MVRIFDYSIDLEYENRTILDFLKAQGYSHAILVHLKKTKNSIGIHTVIILKRRKRVESAVHEAVSVNNNKHFGHRICALLDDTDTNMIPQRRQNYKCSSDKARISSVMRR